MANTTTKKEKSLLFNTMAGLVKSLEGKFTAVDLRNDICVTGRISKVDGYMNIEMTQVVYYNMRGHHINLSDFYVKARNIRYVHIPKNCDGIELLNQQHESMRRRVKAPTKKVFKVSRAQKQNKETVREAYKSRPSTSKEDLDKANLQ